MTAEPNAREFAILVRRTGVSLSFRERLHAYKAGLRLVKMIEQLGTTDVGEIEPAAHFDASEGW